MSKKLNKEQLKVKKKYHKSRALYYSEKIKKINKQNNRIGFKWYD